MKLVLIRHGKSGWDSGADDFDRSLNSQGLKDAPFMAEILKKRGIIPTRIISSPALRALTTARIMSEVLECPVIEEKKELYLASSQIILETAMTSMEEEESLFIVGHNPGISLAAQQILGHNVDMPTSCVVVIDLIDSGCEWKLVDSLILCPKDF
ncbi:hypothetical protein EXM22_03540 [Oceanispirochaeta crateris]|uniref:Histidine phosphatase family protein n=1 Tax=Oceanispirochaeta crateris TaxID=2518645 RepID=A0A5C1QLR4_9SPIO|nr:histidine phosphatase family protein [Oceanispirochaeta crateris]QEN07102.1 hypothetical protein EXM22_03540 [Oceanispirochaeta crateris]